MNSRLFSRLLLCALLNLWCSVAFGATIKKANIEAQTAIVTVEEGEDFAKGDELCAYSKSGKKIVCGTVTKKKTGLVQLKFKSAKRLKVLKPGMKVAPAGESVAQVDSAQADPSSAATASASPGSPFRLWVAGAPAPATPATYNKLGYAAPADAAPESLWTVDGAVASSLIGFSVQAGIPLGDNSLNIGLRYRLFTPSQLDSDYIVKEENPFARTDETSTAFGLWTEYQYLRVPFWAASSFWLSSGLDIDMSTVTVKATKLDDSGATPESEIVSATSKLNVASVRTTAGVDLTFLQPLGAYMGLALMVPVAEFGAAFKGQFADDEARGQADPGADLKSQLGHKKSSFAAELFIGGLLSF